jgi:hypothetical protein
MATDACWLGENRPATQLRPKLKQKHSICCFFVQAILCLDLAVLNRILSEIEFTEIRNVVYEGSYRWREGDKKGRLDQASGLGAGKQNITHSWS